MVVQALQVQPILAMVALPQEAEELAVTVVLE